MNYSRRQLYAMGEPLGECVTRKEGGRVVYGGGGSGGGGQPASQTQTQITELPEWARPYAKDTLSKASALTDINQNPYKTYDANRIAGFSPLQQQAMTGAENMAPAGQLGAATGLAGAAGERALGTQYTPGQFGMMQARGPSLQQYQMGPAQQVGTQDYTGQNVSQYMNPYMQGVVDIQQREAQRQADIAGTQRGAQAARSGAFGGSRAGLMEAEAARNLALQKGDIQAQGQNAAFQNAQQQFNTQQQRDLQAQLANQGMGFNVGQQNLNAMLGVQQLGAGQNLQAQLANQQAFQQAQQAREQSRQYGAGLGMQGLQTGLQAAGQLGQLGGQQFAQGLDINKLQGTYGAQQQALEQQGLSQSYQDFLNQQNYPYKQLGFMSDILRGTPTGSSSVTQMYQPQPGALQTATGLGLGAYGISQLMKAEGGSVYEYADGGSVTSDYNTADIIDKLSDQQLQEARQNAQARKDMGTLELIDEELAQRASDRGGMSAAFNQLPPNAQENMYEVARGANGGIVSFRTGGLNDMALPAVAGRSMGANTMSAPAVLGRDQDDTEEEDTEEEDDEDVLARAIQGGSTPAAYRTALLQSIRQANQQPEYKTRTADERQADTKKYYESLQGMFGDNKAKEFLEKNIADSDKDRATSMSQGKGLAALAAMEGVLSRPGLVQGLGAAGSRFAGVYGDVLKQDKAEKRALSNMQFNLMDADRKEKMGLTRDAVALNREAEKDYRAAQKAHSDKRFALSSALAKAAPAFKEPTPPKPARATQPNAKNTMLADIKAGIREQNPDWSEAKVNQESAERMLKLQSGLPAAEKRAETALTGLESKRLQAGEASLLKFQTISPTKWKEMLTKHGSPEAAKRAYMDQFAKAHNASITDENYDTRSVPVLNFSGTPTAPAASAAPAVRTQNW